AEPKLESKPEPENTREATIEQARKFLKDSETQKATPEQRTEFLKSKGLSDSDIQDLLKEVVTQDAPPHTYPSPHQEPSEPPLSASSILKKEDRPPIITYPEFLTKPTRPPPLVTPNRFLNTVYAFAGLSTLVYGTSKFVLEPMVTSLTESRISLASTAKDNLSKLVSKLEETVSEIPVYQSSTKETPRPSLDAESHYDDPTELFHRDIGIQTDSPRPASPIISTPLFPGNNNNTIESATAYQSRRLGSLVSGLKQVNEGLVSQTEGYADVKTVLEVLRDDLDGLATQSSHDFYGGGVGGGGYSMYGSRQEPDDEIKRAKENIRRVKGVLLSTRNFPGAA
ncbi:peroxisomal membrane anchor protein conserved region-domain-containing protein, partial [Apiosordaria backusii]